MSRSVVLVKWTDAAYYRELSAGEIPGVMEMETVGFLLGDSDGVVVIAHERCEDGSHRSVTTIPRPWIVSILSTHEGGE